LDQRAIFGADEDVINFFRRARCPSFSATPGTRRKVLWIRPDQSFKSASSTLCSILPDVHFRIKAGRLALVIEGATPWVWIAEFSTSVSRCRRPASSARQANVNTVFAGHSMRLAHGGLDCRSFSGMGQWSACAREISRLKFPRPASRPFRRFPCAGGRPASTSKKPSGALAKTGRHVRRDGIGPGITVIAGVIPHEMPKNRPRRPCPAVPEKMCPATILLESGTVSCAFGPRGFWVCSARSVKPKLS